VTYSVNKSSSSSSEVRNYCHSCCCCLFIIGDDYHRWETNKQMRETNTPWVSFDNHIACVTANGILWTWDEGRSAKLRYDDWEPRKRRARLGKERFGGSLTVMVSCGGSHTLVLTALGLWTCGIGYYWQLGHGDKTEKLVLTLVRVEGFRGGQIVRRNWSH